MSSDISIISSLCSFVTNNVKPTKYILILHDLRTEWSKYSLFHLLLNTSELKVRFNA